MILSSRCDPVLTALFTPSRAELGRYEVCTTADAIDDVVSADRAAGVRYGEVAAVEPLDAFGAAGPYDRFAIVRLYGGRRARVAHGWRASSDRFESLTLVSPYPDPSLTHLNGGTMVIHWTVPVRGLVEIRNSESTRFIDVTR
jgi:hypothetical protein